MLFLVKNEHLALNTYIAKLSNHTRDSNIFKLSTRYDTLLSSTRTCVTTEFPHLFPSCGYQGRDCARWNSVLRKRRPLMKIDYPSGLVLTPARVKSSYTHYFITLAGLLAVAIRRRAYIRWIWGLEETH